MSARTEASQESRRKGSMFYTESSRMNFTEHGKISFREGTQDNTPEL